MPEPSEPPSWDGHCGAGRARIVRPEIIAARHLPSSWQQQVESIFFEASGRSFAPGRDRDWFRYRWLGRYLDAPGDPVLVAIVGETVAGYLVGCLHNPAEQPRFCDLDYYCAHFAAHCRRFPAHLHINLAPAYRSRGIGRELIDTFAGLAAAAGGTGVHVVTGKGMRNNRFYERCGFEPIGSAPWNGREVVLLGKNLRGPNAPRGAEG
ncbi:MAG TPA: GNAT family N-acetyltransferase [Hyphomicrobiaceae bacterium]|nr:GNAT family N-acetyltransferase [Hyphomicrobiaceae bacterium]